MKNAKCRKKCCRENSLGTNQHNKTHLQKNARQCQIAINCVKICKNLPLEECGRYARFPYTINVQRRKLKICCPKANSFAGSNQTLTQTALKSLSRHKEKTCSVTQKKTFSHKTQHFGATKKPTGLPSVFCFCEVTSIRQST